MALKLVLTDARTGQVGFWALDAAGEVVAQRRDGRFADPADRDRSRRCLPAACQASTDPGPAA